MTPDRRVVPFRAWHYEWLLKHEATEHGSQPSMGDMEMVARENSWTGVVDGSVFVCAGTIRQWRGRHCAWAYIALVPGWKRHMPWVTEEVRKALDKLEGRIEFTVRADFPAGQRWAQRLGFQVETPLLKAYGPEGEDHVGFVRIN